MTPSPARQTVGGVQYAATAPSDADVVVPDLAEPVSEAAPSNGAGRSPSLDPDTLALRLGLQRQAAANLRRHFVRHLRRVSVLLAADFVAVAAVELLTTSLPGSVVSFFADLTRFPINPPRHLVALLVGLYVTGNYAGGDDRRSGRRLLFGVSLATLLEIWTVMWLRGLTRAVLVLLITGFVVWLVLLIERMLVDRLVAVFSPPARHAARCVFVGPASMCREAAAYPALNVASEFARLGFLDARQPAAPDALGGIEDLPRVLHDLRVETVVVCGYLADLQLQRLVGVALAAGCHILTVPRAIEVAGVHPSVIWSHGVPLMELTAPALHGGQRAIKRALDLVIASVALVIAAPIMLVIALLIKLDSRGPVLFRQPRVGLGGREFEILKFRTMVSGADGQREGLKDRSVYADGRLFKVKDDPRITRIGALLRRTSLDELPQLWNVLRGEMSLVGPRPPLASEVALYEAHHYARFDVKPGITGPWQVSGRNTITEFEEVVRLESEYIRGWTIWKDVALLVRTVPAVVFMRGAQ
jgi:exopolysaccharide biosynthesis polyprenyl glycosylphosphotransferase